MIRTDLEKYYLSITPIKAMFDQGIISKKDYLKAESFIADKYCIKKGNLYRLNNLTIPSKRVIYMVTEKEGITNGKNNNQDRNITKVTKEN